MITQVVIWLNVIANTVSTVTLAPLRWVPGWLSATLIGMVTGVLMLIVFKYTSHQSGIKRTRNQIKANMLALTLFKDNLTVTLKCQLRLLAGAGKLLYYSLVPLAVLAIPMVLILAQMALWYQARPLAVGEESIVTVQLKEDANGELRQLTLAPSPAVQLVAGPVRVPSAHMACWKIKPTEPGRFELQFDTDGGSYSKQLVVANGFAPTSLKRPPREWQQAILHPREAPFPDDSVVQSIEVDYPARTSFTSGTDNWVIYWFLVSMVAAFAARPLLNVNI